MVTTSFTDPCYASVSFIPCISWQASFIFFTPFLPEENIFNVFFATQKHSTHGFGTRDFWQQVKIQERRRRRRKEMHPKKLVNKYFSWNSFLKEWMISFQYKEMHKRGRQGSIWNGIQGMSVSLERTWNGNHHFYPRLTWSWTWIKEERNRNRIEKEMDKH